MPVYKNLSFVVLLTFLSFSSYAMGNMYKIKAQARGTYSLGVDYHCVRGFTSMNVLSIDAKYFAEICTDKTNCPIVIFKGYHCGEEGPLIGKGFTNVDTGEIAMESSYPDEYDFISSAFDLVVYEKNQ
jgi:hypothetical protein